MLTLAEKYVIAIDEQGGMTHEPMGKMACFCPVCENEDKHIVLALVRAGEFELFAECGCDEGLVLEKLKRVAFPRERTNGQAPEERQPPPSPVVRPKPPPRIAAVPQAKLRGYSAAHLNEMDIPPQRWAIPKIVPEGLTILAGGQKKGKSRILYDACIAVASGGMALGKIPVEQGEALYLALEDGDRRLQDRLREILGESPPPEGLFIYPEWPSIAQGGLDLLRQWLTKHPTCRMVALDTIGVFRSGLASGKNSGVYQDDYDLGRSLLAIPREFGISLVGAHHTNKKEDWEDWTHGVSGSVGLTGAADATLLFERARNSPEARLRGTGRDVQDFDLVLHWDETALIWVLQGTYEDEKRSPERYEILELIAGKGALSPRDAADMLEKNYHTTKNLMVKMFRDGELSRKSGLYGIPDGAGPDAPEETP